MDSASSGDIACAAILYFLTLLILGGIGAGVVYAFIEGARWLFSRSSTTSHQDAPTPALQHR